MVELVRYLGYGKWLSEPVNMTEAEAEATDDHEGFDWRAAWDDIEPAPMSAVIAWEHLHPIQMEATKP